MSKYKGVLLLAIGPALMPACMLNTPDGSETSDAVTAAQVATPQSGPWTGTFRIKNVNSGRCIGIDGGLAGIWDCTTNGDQEWHIINLTGNEFGIQNNANNAGQCLSVSGGQGARVSAGLCNLALAMFWTYTTDSHGHQVFTNEQTNMILAVPGAATANSSAVIQWADTGGADQNWVLF